MSKWSFVEDPVYVVTEGMALSGFEFFDGDKPFEKGVRLTVKNFDDAAICVAPGNSVLLIDGDSRTICWVYKVRYNRVGTVKEITAAVTDLQSGNDNDTFGVETDVEIDRPSAGKSDFTYISRSAIATLIGEDIANRLAEISAEMGADLVKEIRS